MTTQPASSLATGRGRLTLLLCAVQFQRALLACATFLLAAAVIALRATSTRGEPTTPADDIHPGHDRNPAPGLTD